MQTIKIEISNDIYDKVISLLQLLPKNKISIIKEENNNTQKTKDSLVDFFQSSPIVGLDLNRNQETYKNRIEF